jgi:hypothetical protein
LYEKEKPKTEKMTNHGKHGLPGNGQETKEIEPQISQINAD